MKKIEDALRGLKEPCTVESIAIDLELSAKDESKIQILVKKDAEIGRILSGGKLFVPELYVRNLKEIIRQNFKEEGFVTANAIEGLYMSTQMADMSSDQLRDILDLAPDYKFLKFDTLVVSDDLIQKVSDQIKDKKFTYLADIPEICVIFEQFHMEGREDFEDLARIFDHIES